MIKKITSIILIFALLFTNISYAFAPAAVSVFNIGRVVVGIKKASGWTASGWSRYGSSYKAYGNMMGGTFSAAGRASASYTGGKVGVSVGRSSVMKKYWEMFDSWSRKINNSSFAQIAGVGFLIGGVLETAATILRSLGWLEDEHGQFYMPEGWVICIGQYPNNCHYYRDYDNPYYAYDLSVNYDIKTKDMNEAIKQISDSKKIGLAKNMNVCYVTNWNSRTGYCEKFKIVDAWMDNVQNEGRNKVVVKYEADIETKDYYGNVSVHKQTGTSTLSVNAFMVQEHPLTESEFRNIMQQYVDDEPTRYVNSLMRDAKGEYTGDVKTDTVSIPQAQYTSAPYTDPITGTVQQTVYNVKNDAATGTTTEVQVSVLNRPDLAQDANTDVAPVLPATEGAVAENNGTETNTQTEQDYGDYDPPEINIPNEKVDYEFAPDFFLPQDGVCPEPLSFQVLGKTFTLSYLPICDFARKIRPIVLLTFMISAAYVIMSSFNKD